MKAIFLILLISVANLAGNIFTSEANGIGINAILESMKDAPHQEQYKAFHYLFEKEYILNSEEGLKRYRVFKTNLLWIDAENKKLGEQVYGITQFTDLAHKEFVQKHLMKAEQMQKYAEELNKNSNQFMSEEYNHPHSDHHKATPTLESDLSQTQPDWRQWEGPIKNQELCGACWAFAALGPIEVLYHKLKGRYTSFSEQYLNDCDYKDDGCKGGYPTNTLEWIKANGIIEESKLPYKGRQLTCNRALKSFEYKIVTGYKMMDYKNSWDSLFAQGPLIVAMDASFPGFELYKPLRTFSPVSPSYCSHSTHALVASAQVSEGGQTYIIARNSWGLTWGYKGYMKILKTKSCNITGSGWLPTVVDGFSPNPNPSPTPGPQPGPRPEPVVADKCVELYTRSGFYSPSLGKFCDSQSKIPQGAFSGVKYLPGAEGLVVRLFESIDCIGSGYMRDENVVVESTTEFPKRYGMVLYSRSMAFDKRANEGCVDFYMKSCMEGETQFSICNDIKDSQDVNISGLRSALSINFDSLKVKRITFYSQPYFQGYGYSLMSDKDIYNVSVRRDISVVMRNTRSIRIERK